MVFHSKGEGKGVDKRKSISKNRGRDLARAGRFSGFCNGDVLEISKDFRGDFLHLFSWQLEFLLAEVHIAFALKGNQVDVGVVDLQAQHCHAHLAAGECLLNGFGHTLGEDGHGGQGVVVEVEQVIYFLLGHHEGVTLSHRIDVEEGVETVVLGAFVGGNFSCNDSAEDCHRMEDVGCFGWHAALLLCHSNDSLPHSYIYKEYNFILGAHHYILGAHHYIVGPPYYI